MLNYIIIDNGNYISPVITPEFIYYLCIINFLKHNPEKAVDICHNGLGPEEQREEISQEYLKFLKVNSIGQNINYTNDKDDDEEFINYTLTTAQELSNNNNNDKIKQTILKYDIDLYFLSIGIMLLILSVILYLFTPKISCIFIYFSLLCFIFWIGIFKPCFN